jgi:PAS domain S-box-containing protein
MTRPMLTLLLVEDFAPDRELYRRYLLSDSSCVYCLLEAESAIAGLELCRRHEIDAILLDYLLPDADGLQFLESLQAQSDGSTPPVVMVTGEGDERIAVQAIKLGAEDYLVKRCLTPELLRLTMQSAIENARLRSQLRQSEARYRAIVEDQTELICRFTPDCILTFVNQAYCRFFGSTPEQLIGKNFLTLIPEGDREVVRQQVAELSAATPKHPVTTYEHPVLKPNGEIGWQQWSDRAIFDERGQLIELQAVGRDISDRVRMEAEFRENEQKFRAVFDQTFELMGLISLDGVVLEMNQTALDAIAARPEDILGNLFWETPWWRYSPEIPTQLRDAISQAAYGQVVRYEVPFYDASGTVRISDFSLKPIFDEHGQATVLLAEGREITERKRDEQRLQESEERLQLGVQVAGVALARFDYASNMVALSPEAAALYGIPSDELLITRDRIHTTFHPDDRTELAQIIQQVINPAGSGWFAREHRVVWPTGEVRWLSVRKQVFFDRSGNAPRPNYAILAAIDITDRKQAEATLQEQLAQIEAIYATAPIGLCFLDREQRYVQLNERLAEINGLSIAEHLGRTVRDILPELADVQEPIFEQILRTGTPVLDTEIQGQTPAQPGIDRDWSVSYYPLIAEGQILGINIMVQEITDRKRADLERNRLLAEAEAAREEAEAANRSKDEFVAIVAHELRSPLNSIAGWAKLLQSRTLDEATLSKALETISRNTQAQVQLVDDLLDISRMVNGALQIQVTPVNLGRVTDAALDIVGPIAETKQVHLDTQLAATSQISGDFNRLQQIVVNLLTNAIKFTPAGGRVTIRLTQTNSQVQLVVSDTGKGISADFLPLIFERYQQGQQNTGSKDGLGLGLAIVKHLVELHAGSITAESAGEGQGATFTVRLPLIERSSEHESNAEPLPVTSLAGIRILMVDDEPDQIEFIKIVLEDYGADVQFALNVTAALKQLPQFKPNIIISDIAMPGSNGYDLLQQLRSMPDGNIPAIALTAFAGELNQQQALQAGFQRHLAKPIDPNSLISIIAELCR